MSRCLFRKFRFASDEQRFTENFGNLWNYQIRCAVHRQQRGKLGRQEMVKLLKKVRGMQEMSIDRPGKIEDC